MTIKLGIDTSGVQCIIFFKFNILTVNSGPTQSKNSNQDGFRKEVLKQLNYSVADFGVLTTVINDTCSAAN